MTMRYGSAPARRAKILELVEEQGFCSTTELVKALGVSDMTVRRDVQRLAENRQARIVHGGVSVLPFSALQGSGTFEVRAPRMASAKRAAAERAAEMVRAGDSLAIDAGTTLAALAEALPYEKPFTVVTHSAPVLFSMLKRPAVQVVVLGGDLHHETRSFSGDQTVRAASNLHVETLYLAASSISARGIYCANDFDAVTKRALIDVANRVVLVLDSSKFQATAMVRVCDLNAIDVVVVDDQIRTEDEALLREHDIEVVLAATLESSAEELAAK